ncbi:cupin [Mycolicibacterium litorale]|nr:cupin [Mycolicibacterium litorale]
MPTESTAATAAGRSAALRDGRRATVLRPAEITPRQRGGGARTIPMISQQVGARRFLNGITIFGPAAAIPEHFHNCDEAVLLLAGAAIAHIDGSAERLTTGDTTFIPAGIPHYFRNASDTEELHIFWTYASVDADRTIVATGVTTRIDEEHGTALS